MLLLLVRTMYLVVCAGAIASYISVSPHPVLVIEKYKFAAFLILLGCDATGSDCRFAHSQKTNRHHLCHLFRTAGGRIIELFDDAGIRSGDR